MEWIFRGIGIGVTITALIILIILFPIIGIGIGIGIIGALILFPLLVWFVLAPSNRFFTFVGEGTAKLIVKAGEYDRALIQWKGYTITPDGDVTEGEERHLFGGLRFYGFWPLKQIYVHRLRWHDIHMSGEKDGRVEEVRFHDETFDHLLLRSDVYWTKLSKAETKPPERIPVDVEFLITMRVVNTRKALFVAPINWVENVISRIDALFRGFVADHDLNELIDLAGKGELIWREIGRSELIQGVIKGEWGIEIAENGIQLKDISMMAEYQAAAAAQEKEKMIAAGETMRIDAVYSKIQEFGDLGRLVRTLEAMEKSPGQGAKWVIPLPDMAEMFKGVFGRPPEAVTPEEFRELREIIEEIRKRQEGGQSS